MTRGAALLLATLVLAGCAREVDLVTGVVKGVEPVIAGSLDGGPWLVEDLNGGGVIDNARLDLTFDRDSAAPAGRVTGRSGCNRFSGAWHQTGATVRLGPLAGTRMMCPPALMALEAKFLAALEAAVQVRFDPTGAAFLEAADGRVIKMRREAA